MSYALSWLPDVLEAAGLKVAPVPGWEDRGRAEVGTTFGVICHHTAGPLHGNMPSLDTLIKGRSDLRGPLAQLGLGRDGTWYVIAAGRANHAGAGLWQGVRDGNSHFIGIEAENTGKGEPWPAVQIDSYQRGVAAILKRIGRGAEFCAGHKEYALPAGRKSDPDFDMDRFRAAVAALLAGAPAPVLIPASEAAAPGKTARPTLRRGASGDLVKQVQTRCGIAADGLFGAQTEAALREFQRRHGMVSDGIVGPKTWLALDQA